MKIGYFGDLTPDAARAEAHELRRMVRRGVDPLEQRRLEREAGDFAAWAEQFEILGRAAGRGTDRSFVEVERRLRRVCEAFDRQPLDDLDAPTIERWRDRMHEEHGMTEANEALGSVKAALNEAWGRGFVPSNETAKVSRIAGELPRARTLSDDEMEALLKVIHTHDDPKLPRRHALAHHDRRAPQRDSARHLGRSAPGRRSRRPDALLVHHDPASPRFPC
jgi:hypothetical protein